MAFHAELRPAKTFKQIIESVKEVVNECTFECSASQMQVHAVDSGHVCLVSMELLAEQFYNYKCEREVQLGINVGNLSKMMKSGGADDSLVMVSDSTTDTLNLRLADSSEERVSEFQMKLMEIDQDRVTMEDQKYKAAVKLPSSEFAKICRDTSAFGENVTLEVTPEYISFAASGDIGTGKVMLHASKHLDTRVKSEVKEEVKVKEEPESLAADGTRIKKENERKRPMEEDDDDDQPKKAAKKTKKDTPKTTRGSEGVQISCEEPVVLQLSLRYLSMFSKAQSVSDYVTLKLLPGVPLQVEFEIPAPGPEGDEGSRSLGYLRYFLAPRMGDGEDEAPRDDENGYD